MMIDSIRRAARWSAALFSALVGTPLAVAAVGAVAVANVASPASGGGGDDTGTREWLSSRVERIREAAADVIRGREQDEAEADKLRRMYRSYEEEVEAWERREDDARFVASLTDENRREYFAPVLAMLAEDANLDDDVYTPPAAIGLAINPAHSEKLGRE